ncbi:limbin isoform X1 [Ranitomeya imitator]|uniref:limbin isoform X1 n=2 Tax=Ranitomeya imitator TaxID=111125 RepID=UPI0037E7BE04
MEVGRDVRVPTSVRSHLCVVMVIMVLYVTPLQSSRASTMISGTSLINEDQTEIPERDPEDPQAFMDARPPCVTADCQLLVRSPADSLAAQRSDHKPIKAEDFPESNKDISTDQKLAPNGTVNLIRKSVSSDNLRTQTVPALIPSWMKRRKSKRAAVIHNSQPRDVLSSGFGDVTFQKCATVKDPQTAYIVLIANNTGLSSSAVNMTNITLQDNVTGMIIQESSSDLSSSVIGMQIFRKDSLRAGETFQVSYTATLNTKEATAGLLRSLPAVITFQNSSEISGTTYKIVAPFSLTAKEISNVLPDHGLHAAGFVIALIISFLLTCATFFLLYRTGWLRRRMTLKSHQINRGEKKESPAKSSNSVPEDLTGFDRLIDILCFEEAENLLQALEDSEIGNMTQADAYLEACRVQVYKDVTGILLRNMTEAGNLSPLEEKRMNMILSGHWTDLQKRTQEEHRRKLVALTAECNLDRKKQMDILHRGQREADDEAEAFLKNSGEKAVAEYRALLDKLHGLERTELKRTLLFRQEEEFAKSYRQLDVIHRSNLHKMFFDQVSSLVKTKPEMQRTLIEHYLTAQEETEDLLDFLHASKKYHMNKRFAVRKNLLYNLQLGDSRSRCLLNSAATQIANLINRTERAGHISDAQVQTLLEKAQAEVLKVKQKLENSLKQETRKMYQKSSNKRSRHIAQKLREQKKDLIGAQEAGKCAKEVQSYLEHWKRLFANHCRELEELYEKHDNDATDEIKEIKYSLTEKAIEDLRHVQSAVIIQEMLKLNVPRLHLQQVLDEHKRETALLAQQLEKEESDKATESRASLESSMRKLDDEFKVSLKEQKNLRNWEQLLFTKVLLLHICVSEDDVQKTKLEFHSGFSQMDITLALPKIQARILLQKYLNDWRNVELQKVDQSLQESENKLSSKTTKHLQGRAAEMVKKSVEDKVLIHEAQIADDKIKQARAELLLQRVHHLKAREYKLGEYMTHLQFQAVHNKEKNLEMHKAILELQSVLLEEKSRSCVTAEYEQLLQTLNQEIRELDKNMEAWSRNEPSVSRILEEGPPHVTVHIPGEGEDLPVSATLRKALNRRKHLITLCRDRLHREEMAYAQGEHLEEKAQMDSMLRLHNQDIRLAAYLTKRAVIPEGMLPRVLSLLLPSSPESEIASLLYSAGHKYSDSVTETDNNEDGADSWRKRKQQELWVVLEKRIRESLGTADEDKSPLSARKKRSILKRKRLRPVKRVSFSHSDSLAKLLKVGPRLDQFGSAEALNIPDTGEKLFIFRAPSMSPTPESRPKKKRNFLNSKKSKAVST